MKISKSNVWNGIAVTIYLLSGGITGLLYGTSFSTILLPIIVYIFFTLLITHALSGEEEKRLIDLNNVALLSYGVSYLLYGLIYKFIEYPYKDDCFIKFFSFLLLLLLWILIIMFLLVKFTNKKWLNNKKSS